MPNEHIHDTREELLDAVHAFCLKALTGDLERQEKVCCLLSGGQTPRPLYRRLADAALPWPRIVPALVDERWVPPSSGASNEGLLRDAFGANPDFLANLVGMYREGLSAEQAQDACNAAYDALPECLSFCLLGMGPDAHTASLFPQADGLERALQSERRCQAIRARPSAVTGEHTERMTLTPAGIGQARRIVLLFTGMDKYRVYRDALQREDYWRSPISAILRGDKAVEVFYSP